MVRFGGDLRSLLNIGALLGISGRSMMSSERRFIFLATVVLTLGACATEDYVDKRIATLADRIGALDTRTKMVDQAAQQANAASQSAASAAQMANQRLDQLTARIDGMEQQFASKKPRGGPEAIATRLFVPPSFRPFGDAGAFGVLVFASRPANASRYLRICEAYLRVFDDAIEIQFADPETVQMVTVWPRGDLEENRSFEPEDEADVARECKSAVSNYSYATAHLWMKQMKVSRSEKRGPFLIAVARDGRGRNAPFTVVKLDLSGIESRSQIENAFHLWIKEIEANPSAWRRAWRPKVWKFYVASRLNQYGKQVIDAMTIVRKSAILN